jgi:hypothetical protein
VAGWRGGEELIVAEAGERGVVVGGDLEAGVGERKLGLHLFPN